MRWQFLRELIMLGECAPQGFQRRKAGDGKSFEQRTDDRAKDWTRNESMMRYIVLILYIR